MRWRRKADETAAAIREERKDDERLREAVVIRQHDIERRLLVIRSQAAVIGRGKPA